MNGRKIAFLAFLAAFALFQAHVKSELRAGVTADAGKLNVGTIAPNFVLADRDGNFVELSSVLAQKKLVVVNFWATWCAPCRIEMPQFAKTYGKYKDRGLEILAVNVDEDLREVEKYLNEKPLPFPVLLDRDRKVAELYGVDGFPTTILISDTGVIQYVGRGVESHLDWRVRRHLNIRGN